MTGLRRILIPCYALLIGATLIGTASADDAAPRKADDTGDFPGGFDKALQLFHRGEGGREGIGMSKLWPRVSVPALSNEQLRAALVGNTFRIADEFSWDGDRTAFYVNPSGTVEAWYSEWDKQKTATACPAPEAQGDDFLSKDGACYRRRFVDVSGEWKIDNHQLCPTLRRDGGGTQQCWYFVMLLNRLALFDGTTGDMLGTEKTLIQGKALRKGSR